MINQRLLEGQAFRNVLKKKINEFKDSQNNIQNVHTPFDLCYDMLNELKRCSTFSGKDFLVLFNLEFVETLISSFGVSGDRIWFVADGKMEAAFLRLSRYNGVKVEVIDMQKDFVVEEMNPFGGKKFDFVVMNPPYQDGSKKNSASHASLWDKFVEKAFQIVKEGGWVCAVHPSSWRKPDSKIGNLIKSKDVRYLEIHDIKDGQKTFGCSTRYDWYAACNRPASGRTIIKDQEGSVVGDYVLAEMPFIPNVNIPDVMALVAKDGEEKCEVLYSGGDGDVRKPWMSKIQTDEFKYPCVNMMTDSTPLALCWSSAKDRGYFGIPKVIVNMTGATLSCLVDDKGEYGMTQWIFGIKIDSKEEGEKVRAALMSENFKKIWSATKWLAMTREWRTFKYIRRDFWKAFV